MDQEGIVVVSLFDGMSCGMLALEAAEIPVKEYYASEIDKYSERVSHINYPEIKRLGDVRFVDTDKLPKVDLLIGGSPCQSFSFAGKRKGMAAKKRDSIQREYTIDEMNAHNDNIQDSDSGKIFYEIQDFIDYKNDVEYAAQFETIEILSIDQYLKLKDEGFEFEGQSYLFWEYMRILEALKLKNPDIKFLLENVVMGSKWQTILSRAIGINPIKINSALLSAQNRERLYWTNIGSEPVGLFGDIDCVIPQPKDLNIFLRDILQDDVDEKYFLSKKMIDGILRSSKGNDDKHFFQGEDKCPTIDTRVGASTHFSPYIKEPICVASRGRNPKNPKSRKSGENTEQMLESRGDGKTNCITSVNKDNLLYIPPRIKNNLKNGDDKASTLLNTSYKGAQANGMTLVVSGTLRTHKDDAGFREIKSGKAGTIPARGREDGSGQNVVMFIDADHNLTEGQVKKLVELNVDETKAGCLTEAIGRGGSSDEYMSMVKKNSILTGKIRRLTPVECERLQTVPDTYTACVSDTQRYKMLGNGWTIAVIKYIFSFYKK